jgi:formimidoylglutamase
MDGGRRLKEDPNWPRASAWLAGDHLSDPIARMAVLGAPSRLGSISGGRFDLAPEAIRRALTRYSTWIDNGDDLRHLAARDLGDSAISELRPEQALNPLASAVRSAVMEAQAVVVLGGDNSVTRPGVRGLDEQLERVGVLTFDAHFDLRDTESGLTNGNPIRALLEDGLPGPNVVQLGIQPFANSAAYAEIAHQDGVRFLTMHDVEMHGIMHLVSRHLDYLAENTDSIYVDVDLDVLDRAFAPACPGSRPGGLTPGDLQFATRLCGAHPKVRAMDLVEVDPTQDVADVTVLAAASFLLSFAAGVASRREGGT